VRTWIERGSLPVPRTFFAGIERVRAGHRLVLSSSGVRAERYWQPRYAGTVSGTRQEVAERRREEAFAAIDRAAAGSRRTAVRLSGGLDSSCVAAGLAARGSAGGESLAFSAVFPRHSETDERELIEATTRHLGLPIEQVPFDDDIAILPAARRHIERWRLPPNTPNLFVWEPVMALARERGVEVMLDGEGGDELFGLAPYLIADRLRRGRLWSAWGLTAGIPGIGERPDPRVRMRALRVFGIGGLVPERARRWRQARNRSDCTDSLLGPGELEELAALEDSQRLQLDGPLWWRSLASGLATGGDAFDVPAHLRREALGEGVERRHPFLFDLALLEAVLSQPPCLQFDPLYDRVLMREALRDRIPEQVRLRTAKSHFTPLLLEALAKPEAAELLSGLTRPDAPVRLLLPAAAIDDLLAPSQGSNLRTAGLTLWRLCMADAWLRSL
jgi:asparagine synthase (glutamine-hydrolysing)